MDPNQMVPGETDAIIDAVKDTEPAPEADKPEETKPDPVPEGGKPEGQKPDGDKPEADKPEDDPKDDEPPLNKPRSIYKDLKDEKTKRRTAEEERDAERARADAAEAELAKARGGNPPEQKPAPKAEDKPADELEAFAKEQGYDAAELARLTEIIAKRIPPSQLTAEERQDLQGLRDFKARTEAEETRRAEDAAIQAEAPTVRKELDITDDAELAAVMKEVTRLAHTKEFADKEVDYIIFRNREALSKMVSPKKPSFESGSEAPAPEAQAEPDLSPGKVTPEMAERANRGTPRSQLEIRKAI